MSGSAETSAPPADWALEMHGITKRFDGVVALDNVDFSVACGSVHALLGENGAGKTTLMRIAYGLASADAGDIRLFDMAKRAERPDAPRSRYRWTTRTESHVRHSVRDAQHAGVGMVHQHLSLVPSLTATENLVLGGRGRYGPDAATELLRSVSKSAGLQVAPDALVRDLSIVEQQRLEILKALARGARLLILDEPTAVLAPAEIDDLLRWIRAFATSGGSVVLVTHKLREALAVADAVTVLRQGRVVHSRAAAPESASSEDDLARAIFPDLEARPAASVHAPGEMIVDADRVDARDTRGARRVRGASFRIHRHEIVGVAGIEGSGQRELMVALAGLTPVASGVLRLPARIAFIPADRTRDAIIPDFTLTENVALHGLGSRRGVVRWRELADGTSALLTRFDIAAPFPELPARALSGGNQQRLVVARELEQGVDLVVADNPTRGLDIRATMFVHDRLREAAARGAAVVVHSSDLDEILALASRVLVVFHSEVRELGLDRETIGRAMLGAPGDESH